MSLPFVPYLFAALPSLPPPTLAHGAITLTAPSITRLTDLFHSLFHIPPSPQPPRITLLTEPEYRSLSAASIAALAKVDTSKVYPIGISRTHESVAFIPVVWTAGNVWRVKQGLPVKDFHIMLSVADEHGVDKSIYSVRDNGHEDAGDRCCINGVWIPKGLCVDVLDQLCLTSQLRSEDLPMQLRWIEYIITSHPESERGWLRLADLAFKNAWWKLAMLSYYSSFTRSPRMDEAAEKRREYYTKRVVSCGQYTEFGPLLTEEELHLLLSVISSKAIRSSLLRPWDPTYGLELPEVEPATTMTTRIMYHVPPLEPGLEPPKLPRFFSWIIPFALAGMSTPRSASDISLLSNMSITHVITLTSETPLPRQWFGGGGGKVQNTLIPVDNCHPPTIQQTDRALRIILEEPFTDPVGVSGATLVHCGGGKGRAGTVLACYLALFGFTPPRLYAQGEPPKMSAKQAVKVLRGVRDGSVETMQQESFVERYVSTAWKRYGNGEALIGSGGVVSEPSGGDVQAVGDITDPDMIVLVGVQGSGKSEFTRLCRIRNHAVTVVSPDSALQESDVGAGGARRACEDLVGHFRKGVCADGRHKKVLILDRCNPTISSRREWTCLSTASGKTIAIHFDYPSSLCISRAENRSTHPSLPPHRARTIIESTHAQIQPPTTSEGFSGIATISSLTSARNLADTLFDAPTIKKFPRTRHLLNLGGATRDDLVIPPTSLPIILSQKAFRVQEKVDGANLGLSLSSTHSIRVQNRSHYISSSEAPQFSKLDMWLSKHSPSLRKILLRDPVLPERYILFGEWLAATHSIHYSTLPDLFLAFDLYDRLEDRFAHSDVLRSILQDSGIACVREMYRGETLTEEMLLGFLEMKSEYGEGLIEGVVVRWEEGGGREERGKVVRGDFIAGGDGGGRHWSRNELRRNGVLG